MKILQLAQRADDLRRATAWYTAFFGAGPVASFPPGLVFFDVQGIRLLLDEGAPSALHYFHVDDIDAAIAQARDAGTTVESEPHIIFTHPDDTLGPAGADEWQAFVRDSEDNLVGLVEQRVRK